MLSTTARIAVRNLIGVKMSDLIRREDAIRILSERAKSLQGIFGDLGGACSGAVKIIKSLPSAEPEVKTQYIAVELDGLKSKTVG